MVEPNWLTVHGVQLEVVDRGRGQPLLVLHGEDGLDPQAPFLEQLTRLGHVLAPSHPGFGHSPDVDNIDTVDDLSYLYLDLLTAQNLREVVVIGFSLGGWVAAEMAVKSTERIAKLILVAPLGIKVGDRETRDIPDIFALPLDEVTRLKYHDPSRAVVDYSTLSDDELTVIARNREATALYAWEPYFHNPKLRRRLHRVNVPTLLLWGASDRFVTAGYYGAAYREAIPGARLEILEQAGHLPQVEQPEAFVERVRAFLLRD
ncbi:MAG TPA: alpha/beta hydrolase [Methylomirabilota bacterium]|jgi:pimeloyl-ACP methyl ester carboxylesterase|nr:alpha/beta hydrolase [Methylomirabilota bacterium]